MSQGTDEILAKLGASDQFKELITENWSGMRSKIGVPAASVTDDHESRLQTLEGVQPGGSEAFPVGSVFISAVSTDPSELLGYGTWAAIGAGRCIVGQDSGDSDFDTLLETGGAKTVTLTEAQIPAHTHVQQRHSGTTGALTGPTTAPDTSSSNPASWGVSTQATGGGQAHPNVQPYIVLKLWQRTT